jgi:formylglycine-generating enzyme required for sulfatase activity/tRNA A-37 threonylcarbamoyl transferase component Bud32
VFLVRDLTLKRPLAVKVLSPDMITSATVLDRFKREAEAVAGLTHPNIVPLYFVGQRKDLLYLAMQYVDGGSIADRIEREGKLPVDDAVRVACETASALAHAHKRGVIHRDIKPANVLIDAESGRSLVTDFGIARTADATSLTATGMMVGTPAYLSPEQVTGEPADHRVDVYALGVMTYEMLAGRLPFEGATPQAAMMKRLAGPPAPLSSVRADVPPHVSDAVARMLDPDRAARPDNAIEVIRELEGQLSTTGGRRTRTLPAPSGPRWRRRAPYVAGGALLLAATVGWMIVSARGRPTSATKKAGVSATSPDSVSPSALAAIPAGTYVIGAEDGSPYERPRHSLHLDAFRIERTEVTVDAYERFANATGAPRPWSGTQPAGTLPVTRVAWGDAANYCAWKYPRSGRLPTEQEWEAAARGTAGRRFPYGNAAEPASGNTASAHRRGPAPVGSFPRGATPDGVEDLSGNVWEWTSSPLRAYPGAPALADSMSSFRVIRGGAFDTADSIATASRRGYARMTGSLDDLKNTGFRCVTRAE